MTPWEMAQDVELDDVRPTTGLRSPATVVCDHRPGLAGLLAAALSGAIVGAVLTLLVVAAAPRSAETTAQTTAVDVSGDLGSSARLTGAPRRLPEGSGGVASAAPAGPGVAA